jgi:RES domain-containing protein
MTVYRIARRAYANLSGRGGLLYSGRWHQKGHPIIYAAGSVALAALECAVHSSVRPLDSVLMEIHVPDGAFVTIEDRIGGELPGNWAFVEEQSRQLGTEWLIERKSLMLSVPSVVIPFERNLLLNPRHRSFATVSVKKVVPFFFDPRVFEMGRRKS